MNILERMIERLDVAKLSKGQAIEALFYITQMIKSEADPKKVISFKKTKAELQNRLNAFRML